MNTNWWRQLAKNRWLDAGCVGIALLCVARLVVILPARATQDDFAHYYCASRLLIEGRNPYETNFAPLYTRYGFTSALDVAKIVAPNPPAFLFLMAPIASLDPQQAYWCWVAIEVGALVAVLWLTCHLLRERLTRRGRLFVVAGVIASAPVYWHYFYGQLGLILAALVLAGYAWHRNGRPILGCLAVTMAGLLKLFPFVLVAWFVWRGSGGWRGRALRGVAVVALIVVVILATGPGRWRSFRQQALTVVAEQSLNQSFNFTVPALLVNLRFAGDNFAPPADVVRRWTTLGMVLGVALMAGAYAVCWWRGGNRELEFCLLNVALLAGSVRAWGHYFVLLIFPAAVAVAGVSTRATRGRVFWLVVALTLLNVMATISGPVIDRYLVGKVLSNDLPLYGLVMLGLLFVREMRSERR